MSLFQRQSPIPIVAHEEPEEVVSVYTPPTVRKNQNRAGSYPTDKSGLAWRSRCELKRMRKDLEKKMEYLGQQSFELLLTIYDYEKRFYNARDQNEIESLDEIIQELKRKLRMHETCEERCMEELHILQLHLLRPVNSERVFGSDGESDDSSENSSDCESFNGNCGEEPSCSGYTTSSCITETFKPPGDTPYQSKKVQPPVRRSVHHNRRRMHM